MGTTGRHWMIVGTLFGAHGLTGCFKPTTTFNSQVVHENVAPIQRMLIVANLTNAAFNDEMYQGFEIRMKQSLQSCGLVPEVLRPKAMELDVWHRIDQTIKEFRPDAALLIDHSGGNIVVMDEGGAVFGSPIYDLKLFNMSSRKLEWHAKSELRVSINAFTNDLKTGQIYASNVLSQLQHDGLLTGCNLTPTCLQERRRVLLEAAKLTDNRERMLIVETAPRCD